MTNTTLGKYTLLEPLGRGGFATVYRAQHSTLKTPAAVKVLHPELAQDEKSRQRFMREAQAASALEHPNIVRVLDLDEDQGQVFIAMDFVPGGSLKQRLDERQSFPRAELLRLLGEVAAALDYAHARGLVHRDVKPSNILLESDGTARLGDFGLVRPADAPHLTQIGSMVGTATYISPEQAEALPSLDGRADQYSLAVVTYEILAARPPFQGDHSTAVSLMHVTQPPPAPSTIQPGIPTEVDEVILRALAKQPAARYNSCAEFARALAAAFEASDLRRFRELTGEARALLAEGKYAEMRQRMETARTLLSDRPDQREALAGLEQARQQAEAYQQGAREWQQAKQKAQAVLDLFPDYPDPQGIFPALELRRPPRRLPPPKEILRQAALGALLGGAGVALALYLAFRFITR